MEHSEIKDQIKLVNNALEEKGYNPIMQIIGYILSEDPAYITAHKGARVRMAKIDRDELLRDIVQNYCSEFTVATSECGQQLVGLEDTQKIF